MAWGRQQDDLLRSLIQRGVINPDTNRPNLREYIIRVTQQHFPDYINDRNKETAIRRMKKKFNEYNLDQHLQGARREEPPAAASANQARNNRLNDHESTDTESDDSDMSDKKPAAKPSKKKAPKPTPRARGIDADDSEDLAAEMERMTMGRALPNFSFEVKHPALIKNIDVVHDTRRGMIIVEYFVYPHDVGYYNVEVGPTGKTLLLRTRIADPFLVSDRISSEMDDAMIRGDQADYAMSQNHLTAHDAVVRDVFNGHEGHESIWSDPPQVLQLPTAVENTIASKEIIWEPGCYELIDVFGPTGSNPPMYAILRVKINHLRIALADPNAGVNRFSTRAYLAPRSPTPRNRTQYQQAPPFAAAAAANPQQQQQQQQQGQPAYQAPPFAGQAPHAFQVPPFAAAAAQPAQQAAAQQQQAAAQAAQQAAAAQQQQAAAAQAAQQAAAQQAAAQQAAAQQAAAQQAAQQAAAQQAAAQQQAEAAAQQQQQQQQHLPAGLFAEEARRQARDTLRRANNRGANEQPRRVNFNAHMNNDENGGGAPAA